MVRRTWSSRDECGGGTLDYVGIVLVVASLVGAVVVAVSSLAPGATCAFERAVASITRGSAPACASVTAADPGETDAADGAGGVEDERRTALSITAGLVCRLDGTGCDVAPDGTAPSGTSTVTMQADVPEDVSCAVVSNQPWAVPASGLLPSGITTSIAGSPQTPNKITGPSEVAVTLHSNPGGTREATITIHCSDGTTATQKIVQPGATQKYVGTGDSFSTGSGAQDGTPDPSNPKQDRGKWNSADSWRTDASWVRQLDDHTDSGGLRLEDDGFTAHQGATTNGNHLVFVKDKKGNYVKDEQGNRVFVEFNEFGYAVDKDGNMVEEDGKYVKYDGGKKKLVKKDRAQREINKADPDLLGQKSIQNQITKKDGNGQSIIGDAGVVTITAGGNDIGFATVVADCTSPLNAPEKCQQSIVDANELIASDDGLKPRLKETYELALKESPNSTIYVVGYPPVVESDDWTGRSDDRIGNPVGEIHQSNLGDASKMVNNLNAKIAETVDEVNRSNPDGPRLVFVDPTAPDSPFRGHSVNDPDPYANGYVWEGERPGGPGDPNNPQTYHPNKGGNDAMRDYVRKNVYGGNGS